MAGTNSDGDHAETEKPLGPMCSPCPILALHTSVDVRQDRDAIPRRGVGTTWEVGYGRHGRRVFQRPWKSCKQKPDQNKRQFLEFFCPVIIVAIETRQLCIASVLVSKGRMQENLLERRDFDKA